MEKIKSRQIFKLWHTYIKQGIFFISVVIKASRKKPTKFLFTGKKSADGYGVLIGFDSDGKLRKSTGHGNYQYGNDVRLATEEEINAFINEVFNYQEPIREYGRP